MPLLKLPGPEARARRPSSFLERVCSALKDFYCHSNNSLVSLPTPGGTLVRREQTVTSWICSRSTELGGETQVLLLALLCGLGKCVSLSGLWVCRLPLQMTEADWVTSTVLPAAAIHQCIQSPWGARRAHIRFLCPLLPRGPPSRARPASYGGHSLPEVQPGEWGRPPLSLYKSPSLPEPDALLDLVSGDRRLPREVSSPGRPVLPFINQIRLDRSRRRPRGLGGRRTWAGHGSHQAHL